ncbi:unnamed protein product [Heterobilharzia americana]|nr:unnamed protein product [Heterobilharzia americana]
MVNRPNEVSEIERNNCSFYSSKAAPSLYTGVNENKTNCVDKKPMRFLLLDISGITHIDPCGATALTELQRSLFRSKLYMILCGDPAPFKCLSVSDWQTLLFV